MKLQHSAAIRSSLDRLKIRSLLAGQDATISDLARHLGLSHQFVSDMLLGKRNAQHHVAHIAAYLGVSPRRITKQKGDE